MNPPRGSIIHQYLFLIISVLFEFPSNIAQAEIDAIKMILVYFVEKLQTYINDLIISYFVSKKELKVLTIIMAKNLDFKPPKAHNFHIRKAHKPIN